MSRVMRIRDGVSRLGLGKGGILGEAVPERCCYRRQISIIICGSRGFGHLLVTSL